MAKITGVILAGGQGRRMGGVDKGLRELRGKPMIEWVLERFAPQVDAVLINANQNLELYATVPCDSPFLPEDLVARLDTALQAGHAQLAVARTGNQPHPVFCLCWRDVLPHLTQFLADGGRKIDAWYATLRVVEVAFDDEADAFSNINTPEELSAFENAR